MILKTFSKFFSEAMSDDRDPSYYELVTDIYRVTREYWDALEPEHFSVRSIKNSIVSVGLKKNYSWSSKINRH